MNKKQIFLITFLIFSILSIGNAQSLSDRLNAFTDKLSSLEKVDMKVYMVVLDENQSKIDQTTIEYKRDRNTAYNKTKDVQILQDNDANIHVTIDYQSKSIDISSIAKNSGFVDQMKAMFSIFDESKGVFEITKSLDKTISIYTVLMKDEHIATYYFDQSTDWLTKVIFHKSTPLMHEGNRIEPSVDITFRYNENVKGLKLKSVLSLIDETWTGKGAFSIYEVQDYRNQISNY
jgi:hypothetical protein